MIVRDAPDDDGRPLARPPTSSPHLDEILIEGVRFIGHHGVFEYERIEGCRFQLDAHLWLDLSVAGRSDRLSDTVDYGAVTDGLLASAAKPSCLLLEHLVLRMLRDLFEGFPTVEIARVRLRKLAPPISGAPAAAVITMTRRRGEV